MKKVINYLCLRSILCLLTFIGFVNATAQEFIKYDFTVDGYYYRIISEEEKKVAITYEEYDLDKYYDEIVYSNYTGSVSIPSSVTYNSEEYKVTSIDAHAFDGSSITSVNIPNSIVEIGDYAFFDCRSLQSIAIPQSVKTIGIGAFNGCIALSSIQLSYGITTINNSTFSDCKSLSSIVIPNSVTSIGSYVFSGCSSLSSVVLSEYLYTIGSSVFYGCSSLTSICLPNRVNNYDSYAFNGCNSLTSVTVESPTPVSISSNTFPNRTSSILYVPFGSKEAYETAGYWKEFKEIVEKYVSGDTFTAMTIEGVEVTYTVVNEAQKTCKVGYTYVKKQGIRYAIDQSVTGIITIPSVVNGYTVIGVEDYAFSRREKLTSVILPSSIRYIGTSAFSGCSGIESMSIPESVTSIGDYAFSSCTNLTTINIPSGITVINKLTFFGCKSLISIELPDNLTEIGNQSFENCSSLTEITIPGSLRKMETWDNSYAFTGCSGLRKITINKGAALLGNSTFGSSPVETVVVYNTNPIDVRESFDGFANHATLYVPSGCIDAYKAATGWSKFKNYVEMDAEVDYSNIGKTFTDNGINYKVSNINPLEVQVGWYTWNSAGAIDKNYEGSLTIPSSVTGPDGKVYSCTSIMSSAFSNCSGLTSVNIPSSVTSIADNAFAYCSGLSSINIPNSITSIGSYAFSGCRGLSSINIPNSVTSIGSSAFSGCSGITSVTLPNTITSLDYTFYGCTNLTSVTIPNSVSSLNGTFSGCTSLTSVTIPNSVLSLNGTFSGCTSLTSITIPKSVTTIDNNTFYSCSSLNKVVFNCSKVDTWLKGNTTIKEVVLGDDVTSIASSAFDKCTGLTSVTIGSSVKSIGSSAFTDCSSLKTVNITNLAEWCGISFGNDYSNPIVYAYSFSIDGEIIHDLVIPNTVTSIGDYTFTCCGALTSVTIPNSVTSIGNHAFKQSQITSLTIPNSVTSIGINAFSSCTKLNAIDFGNSLLNIGIQAFSNCYALTSLVFPNSLTIIDKNAFYNCNSLTAVTIPSSVTTIEQYAFSSCFRLSSVTVESANPIAISSGTFSNRANATLYVPVGSEAAYEAADYWKEFKEIVEGTAPKELAYAVYDNGTLTFKYGYFTPDGTTSWDASNTGNDSSASPAWKFALGENGMWVDKVTKVVFDPSFADARPKTCFAWFDCFRKLETIEGLEYLNTSEVKSMAWMFEACMKLTSLDLTHFDTSNVTDMSNMFAGAVGMTTLDLSSFNTAKVTSTQCMFAGSESQAYGGPNKLKTIYVGDDWTTANVAYSDRMFECCPNLVGGNGTKFSAEHIDKTYACIDAPGTPGYLSKKGQTTTTTWTVTSTEDIPAGTKYELDDITVTIGQAGAPSFTIDAWSPYNETFANRIVGNEVNGDKEGGTFYLFTPKKNGNLTVVVRQGKTKKFYVEESGRVMDAFNGILPETEEDVYIGTYTIPVSANLTYKIYCAGSKMGFYGFTFVGRNDTDKTNITFADEKVKALCVANWDTNGDGELSQAEAAAVTTLGDVFKENREIKSFDELRFFTGLTELTLDRFYTCDKMKSITIPSGVSYIDGGSFGNCSDLEYISVDPGNTTYDSRLNCNAIIEKASCKLVVGCQTTVIPDGVTAIGKDAFWGRWSMSNMNLPESVKAIGSDAFAYCPNLENIILPSSLETIEFGAFTYSGLKSITLPERLTTIGESAFDECENLTEVKVLNPVPLALTNAETFSNRANATLYVPVGCKAAYEAASIWKDFKKIVESGWAVTSTDEIPAGTKVELDDITMTIGQAGYPNFKVDPTYGAYNDTFKNPIIGNEVNGDKEGGTFYLFTPKKNGNLTVVVRQNVGNQKKFYVEESGWVMDAFNGILPETENGIYVGPYTIPVFANLTYKIYCAGSKMGFYGFTFEGRDDAEWTNIAFADEKVKALCVTNWDTNGDGELSQTEAAAVTTIGEVFKENNEIASFNELRFFTGLKDMSGWGTLYGCHSLKTIIIPAGVISLDGATLAGCDALEQISVDPANTVYDSRMGCNGVIETATNKLVVGCINTIIPDNVTTIGNEAFHGRGLLTWIAIPESVTEFEDGAFAWCGSLEDIKIPSGLKTIGGWAFNHTALRSITLPEGLTTIGESAFDGCDNLTEVKVLNPVPLELINAETFSNQANATLYVPNKSITAYKEANIWKDFKGVLGLFTNQIYSDDMTAYLGCSTEMVINMDNEEEYTAYQFDLVLPQGFSLEKDENDKFVLTKGNRYPSNRSITITPHDGNMYRFVSVSMKNDVITGNSGALMTVSLVADENLEKKNYTAEIQNVVLTKTDESQLNAKSSTISITTKEVLMGDSNDDGTLNVTDAVVSVNNILGRPSATFNKVQADINRDRIVDIFDVILGLNLIRNNAVRADRLMSRAVEATSDKLSISDFTIASGDTKQLQIELTNEAAYIGFQFDLFLPEGITLTGYSVNSARVPEEIEVDMEQTDGCYRFIGVGLGTETISGTSGNIISITVKADENLKGRNLTGYLRDVKLSKLDGTGTTNAETPFQITNTTSGDLSGNGSLGPEDVSALVDLIMSDTYEAKADLNGDDKVNAVDLVLLTNLVNQK